MPTIYEALTAALEALKSSGFPPGCDAYDDLEQAIYQLRNGATLRERIDYAKRYEY